MIIILMITINTTTTNNNNNDNNVIIIIVIARPARRLRVWRRYSDSAMSGVLRGATGPLPEPQ